jgi:3-isopropylmalate/(R)-2-methylmalate dehydratase small subunit
MMIMEKVLKGRAYELGEDVRDNVNTDIIIPPENLMRFDSEYLGQHAMDGLPSLKSGAFTTQVAEGFNILVAGDNFGCGSMRAHAVYALGGAGVKAIIATSFARTFYRNAVNCGYLVPIIVERDTIEQIDWGDHLEIHLATNEVRNISKNEVYSTKPFPKVIGDIIDIGGLAEYNKRRMLAKKA